MKSQFPNPFGPLLANYKRLRRRLPREVAIIAAKHFKDNFRRQGILSNGTVISWKPRKFNRKDNTRAILIKSGRLRRAIRPSSSGDYAIVTNDTPYAEIHNEGGKIESTASIGAHTRNTYDHDEVSAPGARKEKWKKTQRGNHQVKAHSRKLNTTIPARPFMVTTSDLENEFEEHLFDEIDKLWK